MLDTNNTNTTAQVLKVAAKGEPNNYTFAVTIRSPDTGCDRYEISLKRSKAW